MSSVGTKISITSPQGETIEIPQWALVYLKSYIEELPLKHAQMDGLVSLEGTNRHGLSEVKIAEKSYIPTENDLAQFLPVVIKTEAENVSLSDIPMKQRPDDSSRFPSFRRARELKQEAVWQKMSNMYLAEEMDLWIASIQNPRTKDLIAQPLRSF